MNVAGYCGRRRRQKRVNISVGEIPLLEMSRLRTHFRAEVFGVYAKL